MSKKKNVIARVGNFEVTKESGPEHDYIRIKAVSGNWGLMYRDDNEMFGKFLAMAKDEQYAETLEATVIFLYQFTNTLVDKEFVTDFIILPGNRTGSERKINPIKTLSEHGQQLKKKVFSGFQGQSSLGSAKRTDDAAGA